MTQPLWEHQRQAIARAQALKNRILIAMEMGTGKTRTAIELLARAGARRSLIVAPKSVVSVWPKEFDKHLPAQERARWHVVALDAGTCQKRAKALGEAIVFAERLRRSLVVVINYEAVTEAPIANSLAPVPWDALVADECHRIKDPAGKRSKALAKLARAIPIRLGLTGTPCPHSPLDLWAQFRMIDPTVFGPSFQAFRYRYAIMGGYQDKAVVAFQRLDELTAKFHRHAYRVRTEDVLDLPPFVDVRRACLLEPRSRRLYDAFERDLIAEIDGGMVTATNALVKLLRLSQFTSGHYQDDLTQERHELGREKRELLDEVLDDLAAEPPPDGLSAGDVRPVVVFARFHRDLDVTREAFEAHGLRAGELSGRRDDLAAWQAGELDGLAVQLQAGGLGVDLTRSGDRPCDLQVYYSLHYSLGDYMQSRARIRRPGQTLPVRYVHLVAANTIDEVVYLALERREEVVRAVVDELRGGPSRQAQARRGAAADVLDG